MDCNADHFTTQCTTILYIVWVGVEPRRIQPRGETLVSAVFTPPDNSSRIVAVTDSEQLVTGFCVAIISGRHQRHRRAVLGYNLIASGPVEWGLRCTGIAIALSLAGRSGCSCSISNPTTQNQRTSYSNPRHLFCPLVKGSAAAVAGGAHNLFLPAYFLFARDLILPVGNACCIPCTRQEASNKKLQPKII